MINGNSVNFQFAKETSYATGVQPDVKLTISSESLNDNYNKTPEGLLTGGIGGGASETMEVSAEGDFATLAKPTSLGYILKGVFGVEEVEPDEDKFKHVFTPVGNAENDFLPSWSITVDRKAAVKRYLGMVFNTLGISAPAGDRAQVTVSTLGYDIEPGTTENLTDTGDNEKSFKFRHGKVKLHGADFADVTSIGFDYNNNCDNSVQTTETGKHHKQPQPGQREASMNLEVLYSSASEALRDGYWVEDATMAVEVTFTDDAGNVLNIELPKAQITDMGQANASGADTMRQSVTISAIDNPEAFARVTLVNSREEEY